MQAWDRGISRCLRAAETSWFSYKERACQLVEGDQVDGPRRRGLSGEELGMIIAGVLVVAFIKGSSLRIFRRFLLAPGLIDWFMVMVVMVPTALAVVMVVAGMCMAGGAFCNIPGSLIVRMMGEGDMQRVAKRLQGEAQAEEDPKESSLNLFFQLLSHCPGPHFQSVNTTQL